MFFSGASLVAVIEIHETVSLHGVKFLLEYCSGQASGKFNLWLWNKKFYLAPFQPFRKFISISIRIPFYLYHYLFIKFGQRNIDKRHWSRIYILEICLLISTRKNNRKLTLETGANGSTMSYPTCRKKKLCNRKLKLKPSLSNTHVKCTELFDALLANSFIVGGLSVKYVLDSKRWL